MELHPDPLVDRFGRVHRNLRVSVTDRCNIRCVYCMPESVKFLPRREVLTFEEIEAIIRVAASVGIGKIRLTGGEPLLRRDLPRLVKQISSIPEIADLGLTTNGVLLGDLARPLREAGLGRINVSLDTIDQGRFLALTRRDELPRVLDSLDQAATVGFDRIKLNAVAIKGFSEPDIVPLATYARDRGFELRFIEYMPLDAGAWDRDKVLLFDEIVDRLEAAFGPLSPVPGHGPESPSIDFEYPDRVGRVGVIASVSRAFCGQCDRLRLTAEGKLRNCLFAVEETDLRSILRPSPGEQAGEVERDRMLELAIRRCVDRKGPGHTIDSPGFIQPDRLMHSIGG